MNLALPVTEEVVSPGLLKLGEEVNVQVSRYLLQDSEESVSDVRCMDMLGVG